MHRGTALAKIAALAGDGFMFIPLILHSLDKEVQWLAVFLAVGVLLWLAAYLLLSSREKGLNLLIQSLACAGFTAFVGFMIPTFLGWIKILILIIPVLYFCISCTLRLQKNC